MANFCRSCGAQLVGNEAFCAKCGSSTGQPVTAPSKAAQTPISPQFGSQLGSQVPITPKSSPVLKIVIALVVLVVLGGALILGGLFFAAHRVSQKVRDLAGELPSSGSSSLGLSNDPCRFLTKEEVSNATGVKIVRVKPHDSGCAYIVEADPAEMLSKHMAIARGTQGSPGGQPGAGSGTVQDVEVFSYVVMNGTYQKAFVRKLLDNLGPTAQSVSGVGDQAVAVGGGMMMVRKGDKAIQITYLSCPCSTDAVKPLAQKLVSAM